RRQEHPVAEAAEGEHLGVEGDTVPAEAAQGPLRLVGLLFGHHQDLALVRPSPAQPLEHLGGLSAPGPAQNQSQHVVLPLSHFVSVLIIPHLGVQKKTFLREGVSPPAGGDLLCPWRQSRQSATGDGSDEHYRAHSRLSPDPITTDAYL